MAFTLQRIDICPRINEFLANFCMRLPIKFITFAKNKHLTLKTKNKIPVSYTHLTLPTNSRV